ncbi:MAG: patatin-like phospholipase family protein [Cardiobacteriaceae bacterium]|nr:patatin-like phospholipase family protein [Cardiobacteriaceae bacterium]
MKRLAFLFSLLLTACVQVPYRPLENIDHINTTYGYRLHNILDPDKQKDDTFLIVLFSGGGSRAAAFGYGVLETLAQTTITSHNTSQNLLEKIDLVHGVSGGSILATYLALHGKETVPRFEQEFLQKNLQSNILQRLFSLTNLPRQTGDEFGRGDLLAEELDRLIYHGATFATLTAQRKGPFAVISATDMSLGQRIEFTQEFFDALCLNLSKLPISRAVAASSAVPLVFSPITLNNNAGHCQYHPPKNIVHDKSLLNRFIAPYQDSNTRPYIHLLDGGLTDNLGLRSLLDLADAYSGENIARPTTHGNIRDLVIISVNAQNKKDSNIDQSPEIPGFSDVVNAIISIPIGRNTQESVRQFQHFTDKWNEQSHGEKATLHFIDLNLNDLPDSALKTRVLNIGTTFYLPQSDINDLRKSAKILLEQNDVYRDWLKQRYYQHTSPAAAP